MTHLCSCVGFFFWSCHLQYFTCVSIKVWWVSLQLLPKKLKKKPQISIKSLYQKLFQIRLLFVYFACLGVSMSWLSFWCMLQFFAASCSLCCLLQFLLLSFCCCVFFFAVFVTFCSFWCYSCCWMLQSLLHFAFCNFCCSYSWMLEVFLGRFCCMLQFLLLRFSISCFCKLCGRTMAKASQSALAVAALAIWRMFVSFIKY